MHHLFLITSPAASLCYTIKRRETEREREMAASEKKSIGHALILPYPSQGHINPMLQFGRRITAQGRLATAAITRFIAATTSADPGDVTVETISDGFDDGGFAAAPSIPVYLAALESVGSQTLDELLGSLADRGKPVSVVVYDSFLPWALDVARRHGAAAASFFTQSVAVDTIYFHAWEGRLQYPALAAVDGLPGLPRIEPEELPSLVASPTLPYAAYLEMVLNQFRNLDKADMMLINSFYELEPEETKWLASARAAMTIGPTVPSAFVDARIPGNSNYAIQLFHPEADVCRAWLAGISSTSGAVYVSFGSMAQLSAAETAELALGLFAAGRPFLWVLRSTETSKLPAGFAAIAEKVGGMLVGWAPQLEILASGAVGCFVTHCGWNSTMEGLALGIPMVGLPQWTDQPTHAKYIEELWGVGLRAKKGPDGLVRREEVERCVRTVMEGERSAGIRRRAAEWREVTRRAVSAGGSSDQNIVEFLDRFCA